jgi:hypothetical protein
MSQSQWIQEIAKYHQLGQQANCLVMDLSKAFDKVSDRLLVRKLKHYSIEGKTNTWIKNFLADRKQTVVEGETFYCIDVECKVARVCTRT